MARRLARLESHLDPSLFDRKAEGYVPTLQGEAVLAEVAVMRDATEAISARSFADAKDGAGGSVRLTAARTLTDAWLSRRSSDLHTSRPGINLEVLIESRNLGVRARGRRRMRHPRSAQPARGGVIGADTVHAAASAAPADRFATVFVDVSVLEEAISPPPN